MTVMHVFRSGMTDTLPSGVVWWTPYHQEWCDGHLIIRSRVTDTLSSGFVWRTPYHHESCDGHPVFGSGMVDTGAIYVQSSTKKKISTQMCKMGKPETSLYRIHKQSLENNYNLRDPLIWIPGQIWNLIKKKRWEHWKLTIMFHTIHKGSFKDEENDTTEITLMNSAMRS